MEAVEWPLKNPKSFAWIRDTPMGGTQIPGNFADLYGSLTDDELNIVTCGCNIPFETDKLFRANDYLKHYPKLLSPFGSLSLLNNFQYEVLK